MTTPPDGSPGHAPHAPDASRGPGGSRAPHGPGAPSDAPPGAPHASAGAPHHDAPLQEDELPFELPQAARPSRLGLLAGGALLLAAATGAFFVGWLPKRSHRQALEASTAAERSLPRVQVVAPKTLSASRVISLPASVQAYEETVVHARADGYVRSWKVDLGDHVEEGALLVEIETPELDQQLAQARAQLAQADASLIQSKATRDYSVVDLERYAKLTPQGVTSQQDLDQRKAKSQVDQASVGVAQAAVEAQRANIRRLTQLKSFSKVTAPFAGKITARMVERGELVSSQSQLFKLAATDKLRVFIQVPQDIAAGVKVDAPAQVTVREYPGRVFDGKVSRSAGSLDATSRTMNTEILVPNPAGDLLVGMYAQVSLTLPSLRRILELPATALLNDAKGLRVATLGEGNKLQLVPVTLERDTGPTVEISGGLQGTERIVKLASADLHDGQVVEIVP